VRVRLSTFWQFVRTKFRCRSIFGVSL
jgi:hypothetical protein